LVTLPAALEATYIEIDRIPQFLPTIMNEIEDPGIPVDEIANDEKKLEEKAKLEV
jgi:hypothetical protein